MRLSVSWQLLFVCALCGISSAILAGEPIPPTLYGTVATGKALGRMRFSPDGKSLAVELGSNGMIV